MIKIEHTEVVGWEAAIRGMRNPMNSWEQSDSELCKGGDGFEDCRVHVYGRCPRCDDDFRHDIFCVGKGDFMLMKNLCKAGSDHRKFMRFVVVYCDITAPLYWWKEYDTYKVGTVANSCSTMHKIHDKKFTMDDFSYEHLTMTDDGWVTDNNGFKWCDPLTTLETLKNTLNACRDMYLKTKNKVWWWQMIQLLPTSYNQKRTVMLNYEVLKNIYHARRNHKLDEWHDFCKWIESLPYSELITRKGDKDG